MKRKIPAFGLVETRYLTSTTRRRFLQTGGMLMAFAAFGGTKALAQMVAGGAGPADWDPNTQFDGFAPGGFIRIGRDNSIILIIPNVEMGQGIYTSHAMLMAEELEVGLDQVAVVPAPPNSELYSQAILGSQTTGNSTSTRAYWEPLRQAGAAARMMLVAAAAQRWAVPPNEITAAGGVLTHALTNQSATYGELVDEAMSQPIPTEVPLKTRDQFRLIGRAQRRLDTPGKVTGETLYGIDAKVPGMRVATVRACPVFGGRLVSFDDSATRAVRGVVDVLEIDNAVAVVGEHFWAARKGMEALNITWDYGENANVSSEQMIAALDDAFGKVAAVPAAAAGDVQSAIGSAASTLEAVYTLPFLAHASLEPINTTVHVRPDGCEIWVGTQVPTSAQQIAAGVLQQDPSFVTLNNHQIGGGFGRRLSVESIEQAVMFAQQVDYPIKIIWTREEDIQHDVYRPMYRDRISGAVDADGRLSALVDHISGGSVLNSFVPGGYPVGTLDSDAVSGIAETPYAIPNQLVDWTRVDPPIPLSWWRGVGETHNCFVLESFLDELAHGAGIDPIEFRLRSLGENPRGAEVLRRVAIESGWDDQLPPRVGRGVSFHQAFTSPLAVVTEVEVTEQGQVILRRVTAVVDPGVVINPDTIVAQIQGGLIFGYSAALYNGITISKGRVVQNNFNDYRQIRIDEIPPINVHVLQNSDTPGGVGESGTVSAAPSLGNAIFAATGVRLRTLPFSSNELAANVSQGVRPQAEAVR